MDLANLATKGFGVEMINNASVDDLKNIPGVGEEQAEKIIHYRDEIGGFKSFEDVKKVPGVSAEALNALRSNGGGGEGEESEDSTDE